MTPPAAAASTTDSRVSGDPCTAAGRRLIVTCEHGGNRIPAQYRPLFRTHRALLQSHRGYDPGALALARDFAAAFDAELVYSTTSRLLVELNRSTHHRQLFSQVTRGLPREERAKLLARFYHPHRDWIEAQVRENVSRGAPVLHLSCHSFTPRLNGKVRRADIGLLYDPRRPAEREFCKRWQRVLRAAVPSLVIRRNYPYRGSDDGLTMHLRRLFSDAAYAGVEIEVNQKYPLADPSAWRALRRTLVASLAGLVQ